MFHAIRSRLDSTNLRVVSLGEEQQPASTGRAAESFGLSVARSAMSVFRLCVDSPSDVRLLVAFACLLADTCAFPAGGLRRFRAAFRSCSSNSSSASRRKRDST
ncbi:MAG: hypothetical protein OXH99_22810 [Bryobacterales bacterium]|nr:hypothetical protein [Bryobacterales bacterium]